MINKTKQYEMNIDDDAVLKEILSQPGVAEIAEVFNRHLKAYEACRPYIYSYAPKSKTIMSSNTAPLNFR